YWDKLAAFVVVFFIMFRGVALSRSFSSWGAAAVFVAAVVLLYSYYRATLGWTCTLGNGPVVIGSIYKPAAARYMLEHPDSTCADLLESFASDPLRAYDESTVYGHEIALGALFVLTTALL